ncbi:sulfatase [Maribacter polysaccharolyticus]|uniref:sulfatase n=1 Tax=Maribacter polysaccharolyticus TaxID=3020831 RepID=UPI00237FCA4A|nr:sulfatase [Maribacter polysaccharolyticus]MDE3741023.1 sulfatase [Maribacter polysaccharolyticus]
MKSIHTYFLIVLTLIGCTDKKGTASVAKEQLAKKPNILFLSIDDLRPDLGSYGNKEIKTPNIDALAASSMVMLNTHSQAAVCAPSRASTLLGYRPDSTRVWHLGDKFREINPEAVTMPQYFNKEGYYTVNIGKIFHNYMPDSISWDEPDLRPAPYNTAPYVNRDAETYYYTEEALEIQKRDRALLLEKRKGKIYGDGWNRGPAIESADAPDSLYYDAMQTELALQTIDRIKDKKQPFFMGLGLYRPHLPFVAPKKYWDLYPEGSISPAANPKLPENAPIMSANSNYELRAYHNPYEIGRPEDDPLPAEYAATLKRGYYASVSFIDACVGKLIEGLKERGLYENTIIVLWGDHGWKLGDHNGWGKMTNFYIDTHVPLIIKQANQNEGKQIEALSELVDIFPTLCDLAEVHKADYFQGTSLTPLFNNPDLEWKDAVFTQFRRRARVSKDGKEYMGYSMQTKQYHYIEWYHWDNETKVKGTFAASELYDHSVDPNETLNIVDRPDKKELVQRLSERLSKGWKAAVPQI